MMGKPEEDAPAALEWRRFNLEGHRVVQCWCGEQDLIEAVGVFRGNTLHGFKFCVPRAADLPAPTTGPSAAEGQSTRVGRACAEALEFSRDWLEASRAWPPAHAAALADARKMGWVK